MKNKKYPKYYYNIEQRTDEWFSKRAGKLSASNAQSISANGKGLETYVYSLLAEKYSQNKGHYTNSDIERGIELEPMARDTYTIETGNEVKEIGFIEMDELVGCSPDGLVGEKGMIEIKCPSDKNYFKFIIDKKIESKWIWQMQMQLLVAERDWVDFVAYNPNFDQNLIVVRVKKDIAMQEKLIIGIEKGKNIIKKLTKHYENNNQF